jgi:hypothetical protein
MAIPLVALQGQGLDTTNFLRGMQMRQNQDQFALQKEQLGRQNALTDIQTRSAGLQYTQQQEDFLGKNVVDTAYQMLPHLANGDTEGAKSILTQTRERLKAQGIELPPGAVDQALDSGDINGAIGAAETALQHGIARGWIQKPEKQTPASPVGKLQADRDLAEKSGASPQVLAKYDEAIAQEAGGMTAYQKSQLDVDQEKLAIERAKLKQGPDGDKQFKQATELRKEFIAASKDYQLQNDAIGRIAASAKDPSAAGDLSLIFNYMKVLDPGSTVREGEFATAQNSGGIPDRAIAAYNKVLSGERLSGDQRSDFVNRANKLYKQAKEQHKKRESEYSRLAKQNNLDPQNVIVDFSSYQPEQDVPRGTQPAPAPGIQEGITATNPQTGAKIIFKEGQWQPL